MAHPTKTWFNKPSTSTPISAQALIDLEDRMMTYADNLANPQVTSALNGAGAFTITNASQSYQILPDRTALSAKPIRREIWNTHLTAKVFYTLGTSAALGQGGFIPPYQSAIISPYQGAVFIISDTASTLCTFIEI